MRQIIGLTGFKGSGKDTVAKIIQKHLPNTEIIAFADPVKRTVSEIFSLPLDMLEGRTEESRIWRDQIHPYWSKYIHGITPRKMLTMIGSDVLRKEVIDELWILNVKKKLEDKPDTNFVVSDTRFLIEDKMLKGINNKNNHVTIARIHREIPFWYDDAIDAVKGNKDALQRLEDNDVHASEWEQVLVNPDIIINNEPSVSLDDLEEQVVRFFNL